MKINGKKLLFIIIIAIPALLLIAKYTTSKNSEAIAAKPEIKPAAVAVAEKHNLSRDISLSAELKPFQEVNIYPKVSGYLKSITVDVGDQVKSGQEIALLDIDELKDDLTKAKAAYDAAKLDYSRVSEIIKKKPGLLAQEEVDKAKAEYDMAKANYDHARTLLDYSRITTPFAGIITQRFADKGALIQAGISSNTLPIVHLADNTKLRLVFPVPESAVPGIKVGNPVSVTVSATGQNIESKIARVSGKIDSATRTMETEVDIENNDLKITPGMYAEVKVKLEEKPDVLALPIQAVSAGEKSNVWLVNNENEIEERPIETGIKTPNAIEIVSGINKGDRVIFGNRNSFAIGMKVEPKIVEEKNELNQ